MRRQGKRTEPGFCGCKKAKVKEGKRANKRYSRTYKPGLMQFHLAWEGIRAFHGLGPKNSQLRPVHQVVSNVYGSWKITKSLFFSKKSGLIKFRIVKARPRFILTMQGLDSQKTWRHCLDRSWAVLIWSCRKVASPATLGLYLCAWVKHSFNFLWAHYHEAYLPRRYHPKVLRNICQLNY